MSEGPAKNLSPQAQRAERLAAKLRENLRRRKAQARAAVGATAGELRDSDNPPETETLSNPPRDS